MDYLRRTKTYIINLFYPPDVEPKEIRAVEIYSEIVLRLFKWEDAKWTLLSFTTISCIFWVLMMLQLKLYGVIALVALILFIADTYYRKSLIPFYTGTYTNELCDIKSDILSFFNYITSLRLSSPFMFATIMCMIFWSINTVSRSVSGYLLTYQVVLLSFVLPLLHKQIFQGPKPKVKKRVLAEEELIPYIDNKDLSKRDADLDSLMTDKTAESISSSLMTGLSSMPSYLEIADFEDIQEEDLTPSQQLQSLGNDELLTDSDSDHKEEHFDSDHFKTSSSESSFEVDSQHPQDATMLQLDDTEDGVLKTLSSIGKNIVNIVYKNTIQNKKQSGSESDSDFEIVNSQDVE